MKEQFLDSIGLSEVVAYIKICIESHIHTKDEVGLENVDNTPDSEKSVKYAVTAGNASKVNNHTVEIDVPSDAKFTDTDTWRGIKDNLTSYSASESLSANQGRVLKGLIDDLSTDITKEEIDSLFV